MVRFIRFSAFFGLILVLSLAAFGSERAAGASDSYDAVLHSQSLADQRAVLTEILENPQKYVPRIQQSLRDYPRLLRTDPMAAKRAVYISALLRDPSFPPILVKSLGSPEVLDDCIYACPVVFALTIQAYFGGWKLPTNLDSELTTVGDLKAAIDYMPRISLKPGSIEDVVQGPGVEKHRKEIAGKTEEELIRLAGPTTSSVETRIYAADALEASVSGSKNRIELYLLALNDFEDASSEYRGAVYQSIFRAELATRQESPADRGPVYVGLIDRCVYPTGLREEMARKYPGTRPIRWEDLDEYDRQYFQKGMGARCPGLLKVNFYGDGRPTWAIGLVKGAGSNRRVELVVVRQLGKEWEMRSLLTLDGADSPVIMSQGPGEYREDPGGTTIQAKNSVIIFINWGSWAFTWIDGQVRKIMP